MGQLRAGAIASLPAQLFFEHAAKTGSMKIAINCDPTTGQPSIHLDIIHPNELTKRYQALIELIGEHLQFSLSTLTKDDQAVTELIEAGFFFGLFSILEDYFSGSKHTEALKSVLDNKNKLKQLINTLLTNSENKQIFRQYEAIPKVSELFVEAYTQLLDSKSKLSLDRKSNGKR
jgi:hypothetical protein